MAIGFVLINVGKMNAIEVNKRLRAIPEVVEHHPLLGEFDFIAKIESDEYTDLSKIVTEKIRTIPAITNTRTLTGINLG